MATPIPDAPPQLGSERELRAIRPGGVADRYRSLFLIGRGGMGSVEVAVEQVAKGFERIVALKRLLPEGARDRRHKEMFLREARLAALLAHPNVVHAFAFGELYGELFMAMEYVEGEPLSHVLRTAQEADCGIAPELVGFVLAQVCDGLHAAHELRDDEGQPLCVVHRDVSPHNVMIAYDGHVKLLDFGVAKFEAGGHETRTGEVKGKMAYMSPEQALGEKLDRRSDLFSIGSVLFECVTGRRMWGSGTDLEVMRKLALDAPPRLDATMPSAPRALVDLHARLVARDPERRPPTAQHVANELRAVAASLMPAPSGETVRDLMQFLFGRQAQGRQAQLTDALRRVAPAQVDALQGLRENRGTVEQGTLVEPLIVRSAPSGHEPRRRSPSRIVGVLMVMLLVGLAAASAAVFTRRDYLGVQNSQHSEVRPTATSETAAATTATSTATVTPADRPFALPVPTMSPPRITRGPSQPSLAAAPAPSPPPLTPRPRAPAPTPTLAPTKLPDVDPTPF